MADTASGISSECGDEETDDGIGLRGYQAPAARPRCVGHLLGQAQCLQTRGSERVHDHPAAPFDMVHILRVGRQVFDEIATQAAHLGVPNAPYRTTESRLAKASWAAEKVPGSEQACSSEERA